MNYASARAAFSIVACLLFFSVESPAERIADLDTPLRPGSTLTYKTFVGRMFDGIHRDAASGEWVTASEKSLRQIGTKDRTVVPAGAELDLIEALRIRGDSRGYVVILAGARFDSGTPGRGASALAIFVEGSAEPLDIADVNADVFCSFAEQPTLRIGPDDAFIVANSHFNSNQSYLMTTLFHIHGRQLRQIDSIRTLSVRGICRSFDETLTWRTEAGGSSSYPPIVATVTLTAIRGGTDCPERDRRPAKQSFTSVSRFDRTKGRFITTATAMKRLDHFNEQNY